mmetsp:Transcript_35427/g.33618  ORF Transcript_35427/g.33618 Transcript_35427/m.33618 type:complete len:268 (+) Transcript_35427:37-840(+)|eukprot:CAMPEP_0119035800 /NCGR_PEP_ID=MMETSP1177-20130426/3025_1 /TAXON_ID=2985 /ORGANISM="Ochromonas sp, Strain CCMP1899" /LENGTH=267 /DNA_ID=CAMNT_0006994575 /DNA_START=14 /DNA_END=817 /DNA_ORIENTATION=-
MSPNLEVEALPLNDESDEKCDNEIDNENENVIENEEKFSISKTEMDRLGDLSEDQVKAIVKDFIAKKHHPDEHHKNKEIIRIEYDTAEGKINAEEMRLIIEQVSDSDSKLRYAGYTSTFARAFRYLAFTSDFGEALRPVISSRIVTGTYCIAFGYCIADIGYEAYKLKNRGYLSEKNEPMTMNQLLVERSIFQLVASIIVPTAIVHTSVHQAHNFTKKIGKFQRWGPSIFGLCIIPLLPIFVDPPVEHVLEWGFERFGPWAHKAHKD